MLVALQGACQAATAEVVLFLVNWENARGRGLQNNFCPDSVQTYKLFFTVITRHELYGEGGSGDFHLQMQVM